MGGEQGRLRRVPDDAKVIERWAGGALRGNPIFACAWGSAEEGGGRGLHVRTRRRVPCPRLIGGPGKVRDGVTHNTGPVITGSTIVLPAAVSVGQRLGVGPADDR